MTRLLTIALCLTLCGCASGQTMMSGVTASGISAGSIAGASVTNYGAYPDAVLIPQAIISSNSATLQCPANTFTSGDVGKVVGLGCAGPVTSGTNHQDLVAVISAFTDSTHVTLDRVCGATFTNVTGIYGTYGATGFQGAVNAASGTNFIINVPAPVPPAVGYILWSPQTTNANFSMGTSAETHPAFTISKGGVHFVGAGSGTTTLFGCGFWKIDHSGQYVYRGYIVGLVGPVTNDAPISFEHLKFDGLARSIGQGGSFPANVTNGNGWDLTHDVALVTGSAPYHQYALWNDCVLTNWAGEMLKSSVSDGDGYNLLSNCVFNGGNASAINFSFTHTCLFSQFYNVAECEEFYQAYCTNASYFDSNYVGGGVAALFAINGAQTNRTQPAFNLRSNYFTVASNANGIQTTPAQNVNIWTNTFVGSGSGDAVDIGVSGYQGTGQNTNISIVGNYVTNISHLLQIEGTAPNSTYGLTMSGNTGQVTGNTAAGYGWSTNVNLTSNSFPASYGANSSALTGQWFFDDKSNTNKNYDNFDYAGISNVISYSFGCFQDVSVSQAGSSWYLDDSHAAKMPASAVIHLTNQIGGNLVVHLSQSGGSTVTLASTAATNFYWTNGTSFISGP